MRKNLLDLIIVLALFITSFLIALSYINAAEARGQQPEFYQSYFEPAVMLACGKGFVVSNNTIPALQDFLQLKTSHFSCGSLPTQLNVTDKTEMRAWYYMLTATGITWKLLGISWDAVNKLVAFLFSLTIIASYGIFRLGMGRSVAFIAALFFATSTLHQNYLLYLRDYSKAPFILAAIFALGLLVTRAYRFQYQLLITALLGAILGIGYGFRPDVLIVLPITVITLLFFLPGKIWRNLPRHILLAAIFISTFWITATPVFKTFHNTDQGTCTYHFAELGLSDPFNGILNISPTDYNFIQSDLDEMSYAIGISYGQRVLHTQYFGFCSKGYDHALGAAYLTTIKTFPADFIARAYSSILRIQQAPSLFSPASKYFSYTEKIYPFGPSLTVIAILTIASSNLRLAIYTLLLIIYFLGYPAIQFNERHYFHLAFWNLWVLGFLVWKILEQLVLLLQDPNNYKLKIKQLLPSALIRIISLAIGVSLVFSLSLWAARYYQTLQVQHLIKVYKAAPTVPLKTQASINTDKKTVIYKLQWPQKNPQASGWAYYSEMLHLSLGGNTCSATAITPILHYSTNTSAPDFSASLNISLPSKNKTGDIYVPVYFSNYIYPDSIILPIQQQGCIQKIERITSQDFYPLWITLTLPSDWEKQKLYQQINFQPWSPL